jgi:parallel beta-helix repeat protein
LAITQNFAIPENVIDGDFVGVWRKTYTWQTIGTISYSIEQNYNNAFTINSSTGLITINNASDINGKITQQDSLVNLIIKTRDSGLRSELDTAIIRIKEQSYCHFIDPEWAGTEAGTREQPFSDRDNADYQKGHAYFIKRGTHKIEGSFVLARIVGTKGNPTVIGAYGSGTQPVIDGNGGNNFAWYFGTTGVPEDSVAHLEMYDITTRNYAYSAVFFRPNSCYLSFYNMKFWNCGQSPDYYIYEGTFTGQTIYTDTLTFRPIKIQNCEWDTVSGNHSNAMKIGCGPNQVINCSINNCWGGAGLRFTQGKNSVLKHTIFRNGGNVSGEFNLQIRGDSMLVEDIYIDANGGRGINLAVAPNPHTPENCRLKNMYVENTNYAMYIDGGSGLMHDNYIEDSKFENSSTGLLIQDNESMVLRRNEFNNCPINFGSSSNSNIYFYHNIGYVSDLSFAAGNNYHIYHNTWDDVINATGATNENAQNNYARGFVSVNSASHNIDMDTINVADHFENYQDHDYKLKSTALSAINKASNLDQTMDFSGNDMTGNAWDIGAWEYIDAQTQSENNPPVIENQSFLIIEDDFTSNLVGQVIATDEDEEQSLSFSITSGNEEEYYSIDKESGELFLLNNEIFDLDPNEYNLIVKVEDNAEEMASDEAIVKIIVQKSGEVVTNNPPEIDDQQFTINENTFADNYIGEIIASDSDPGQTISYSILSGNESGLFTVDSESGVLRTTISSIFELAPNEYNLVIRAEDNGTVSESNQANITVLLVKTGEEVQNTPPVINDQQFLVSEEDYTDNYIGKIVATEEDPGQTLSYVILSGNEEDLFALDISSGELTVAHENIFSLEPESYDLVVQVSDNAEQSESDEATITIMLDKINRIVYIDPDNHSDDEKEGSLEHPFDSWQDVEWIEGYTYLQKRGSVANETSKISIYANNITIGAYGEGDEPTIWSTSDDYTFRAFDKSNLIIQDLHIVAENAISSIYFLGDNNTNNLIENCRIEGSIYGIRIVGGNEFTIQYNTFRGNSEAIYSYAEKTKVFYNVFESNQNAFHVDGENSNAEVYNNVFYDNNTGVSSDYAELTLHNNIFYLAKINDKAIDHNGTKLMSDYNLYYPNQDGLISYNGETYTNLAEFQEIEGIDANSFTSDPRFVDVFNHNFRLELESPAIDAGIYLGITADLMGEMVPYGNFPDLGVIEINEPANPNSLRVNEESILNVFPNPTDGVLNIAIENPKEKDADLQIQDVNGVVIMRNQLSSFEQSFVQQVDISELPAGIYILSLKIANSIYSKRITKSF